MKESKPKTKLTDKEEEIMLLFWQNGPLFVREVMELLPEPRPHVNTVSTFVRALESKGYLSHEAVSGSYRYFAAKPIEDYRRRTVGEIIRNYFNNSYKGAVCSLVEDEKLSANELRELIEIMETKSAELKSAR
ncbi:MAG: BlaI/MecI/CopY family transcriptional regulator [Muribaculaceae bacterium]|nr:BlaI/MecI/CopY family transcriptional regulator [Muribaculaceae bacterium]